MVGNAPGGEVRLPCDEARVLRLQLSNPDEAVVKILAFQLPAGAFFVSIAHLDGAAPAAFAQS
jgi:hypothetical protein